MGEVENVRFVWLQGFEENLRKKSRNERMPHSNVTFPIERLSMDNGSAVPLYKEERNRGRRIDYSDTAFDFKVTLSTMNKLLCQRVTFRRLR